MKTITKYFICFTLTGLMSATAWAQTKPVHTPPDTLRVEMDSLAIETDTLEVENENMQVDTSSWPLASRIAVREISNKYGNPDAVSKEEITWLDKGVWKKICVSKNESKHSFPIEHTDMMTTVINYKVPHEKMDDLGRFDGSITFDRTQGTLSARCDQEENNILAINLAHDIITGKKTVEQARVAYGNIIKEKMNGINPSYMQKLSFNTEFNTTDPDRNTTGLTKEDVAKGKKSGKK